MMTGVHIKFNILNEEIVSLDSQEFMELIEDVLLKGFSDKGIVIEIQELHRR
jgi:hypothetical protein